MEIQTSLLIAGRLIKESSACFRLLFWMNLCSFKRNFSKIMICIVLLSTAVSRNAMWKTTSLLVECRWFLSRRGNEMCKGVYMGQGISAVHWLSNLTAFHLIIDYWICTLQSRIKLFCALLSLPTPLDSVNPCGGEVNGVNCCKKKILCKLLLLGKQNSGTSTIYK